MARFVRGESHRGRLGFPAGAGEATQYSSREKGSFLFCQQQLVLPWSGLVQSELLNSSTTRKSSYTPVQTGVTRLRK